jgi:acyl-CoA dehydrogenase
LKPVLAGEIKFCFAQTEPDAGSDPANMRTRAVQDGDGFIINGTKRFITGAGRADYTQLMAVTDPEKKARGGITCFAVDLKSSGVVLERQWPTMMGEAPWQIQFDNVRVPAANVIGPIGGGFSLAQKWIGEGRIKGHGARPVGIARRALDMMIEYSKVRVTFGRPLADRQAIQFMIADSAMELQAVRNMVYECAWRVDRGEDVRDLSYMVKIMATEMACRVVDRAIQVHGGLGLMKELPLEWWYRQIRSTRITEGANEVLAPRAKHHPCASLIHFWEWLITSVRSVLNYLLVVIPADAGIQSLVLFRPPMPPLWMPACAGMTNFHTEALKGPVNSPKSFLPAP